MDNFEKLLQEDLHRYLRSLGEADERLPECPDVEEKWDDIAQAYIPDGIREFGKYPTASLGWMMYIGMAVAKYWDCEWETYSKVENLYAYLRDRRGYDAMDEYVREVVLLLSGEEYKRTEDIVGECAARIHSALLRQGFEPGTKEAFRGYVACLRQLYLFGSVMQLHRMGYHMTKQ